MRALRTVFLATAAVSAALGVTFLALPPGAGDTPTDAMFADSALVLPAIAAGDPALARLLGYEPGYFPMEVEWLRRQSGLR